MSNSKTPTKAGIVDLVNKELGFKRQNSKQVVETLIEVIKKSLEAGENLLISGFGKFCLCEKSERRGRNPATGEEAVLPARRVVTFKCSRKLREKVNGK